MTHIFVVLCMLSGVDKHLPVRDFSDYEAAVLYVDSEERIDEDCYIQENVILNERKETEEETRSN